MPESPAETRDPAGVPGDQECPCCKVGGWLRDLPPHAQAQGLDLGAAPEAFLAAPPALLLEWSLTLVTSADPVREATGPPGAPRPHAAPVGSVRLQT